ncbi:unnamed protein product [Phytophthora lilii]|uniref:Unnamed protein product n=1 Tax=Phytophthora lilii TaxID=2077276 RepID=A0A9W6WKY3_9STRA|nr:unnamed protein product [Phytophthora lilii]
MESNALKPVIAGCVIADQLTRPTPPEFCLGPILIRDHRFGACPTQLALRLLGHFCKDCCVSLSPDSLPKTTPSTHNEFRLTGILSVDIDDGGVKRLLRAEATAYSDDEERALPASVTKLTDKLKPVADKIKPITSKLTPVAAKLTDTTMAVAVRLKPIADKFSGKLKPIADKLIPILKPIGAKLNSIAVINKVTTKFKAFVQMVKNFKIGEATIGQRYTMAKFEYWFKQKKTPDDVKVMLKIGTEPIVNAKNQDLWIQYQVFYKIAKKEKEAKVKIA